MKFVRQPPFTNSRIMNLLEQLNLHAALVDVAIVVGDDVRAEHRFHDGDFSLDIKKGSFVIQFQNARSIKNFCLSVLNLIHLT